jgi:hypothetical protein
MEKFLIFIKHHFRFLWKIIEWGNGFLFSSLYKTRLENILQGLFEELTVPRFSYKRLIARDIQPLHYLITGQPASDLEYFRPHGFDISSLDKQFRNPSFLMMGTFDGEKIVGYFFLRFFATGKCFVGRLIDQNYRGKGIGETMNTIMYEVAWRMGFRCLSTISRHNTSVMKAHAKNPTMIVLKELQNDYLLVEFVKNTNAVKAVI